MRAPAFRTLLLLTISATALGACSEEMMDKVTRNYQEPAKPTQETFKSSTTQPSSPTPTRNTLVTGFTDSERAPDLLQGENREKYLDYDDNPVNIASENPVSTFSVDVDTVSYSNVRRLLAAGQMPPKDAVRAEEMINYFDYDYPRPADTSVPFTVTTEIAPTPWNADSYLVSIGIQGYDIDPADRPPANLVFLIDVSGSMDDPAKLPLLVNALKLMVQNLDADDRVSIVVYAGAAGVVLEPTPGNETATIAAALDQLSAGGSTAGGEGLALAYSLAKQNYVEGGINRVILATDGDFNVGVTDFEMLKDMVERERASGIELTTLGFGGGNYNEALLEQIADVGNGNAFYIDTLNEARKVLVEELSATLFTIAQDVKIQVEFNPAVVAEYRLIGYENRQLEREDFNNDKVDAGDIGAGHTVTAIYEVVLVGSEGTLVDPLRYGDKTVAATAGDPNSTEFANVKLRYKLPGESESKLIEKPLLRSDLQAATLEGASDDLRFAAAVAAYAQLLRGGEHMGDFTYADVIALAQGAKGEDKDGYRAEFIQMVKLTAAVGS